MDGIQIYHGDCREILPQLPKVDLVLTSPPYDNLRDYGGHGFDWPSTIDAIVPVIKDGGVCVWVVGDATINGSETGTSFRQALYFMEKGIRLHDTMIWDKGSCRYPETNRYYPCFEYMFIFTNGRPNTFNPLNDKVNIYSGSKVSRLHQMRLRDGDLKENSAYQRDKNRRIKEYGIRLNVWEIAVSASNGDKLALEHPASFPERLS